VLHGITSRETYLHLGCTADLWAASRCLAELYPAFVKRIDYAGSSFGGGIGALATPWDHRIRRVALDVPSFGNHPLRLTLPCIGSGEAVRSYHRRRGDVLPVLSYFDAATAACYLQKPTLISAARFDPAVPPPGQVCVYNALPHHLDIHYRLLLRDAGHFESPTSAGDLATRRETIREWFDTPE
jgi:cephalosporin-C deacetylase